MPIKKFSLERLEFSAAVHRVLSCVQVQSLQAQLQELENIALIQAQQLAAFALQQDNLGEVAVWRVTCGVWLFVVHLKHQGRIHSPIFVLVELGGHQ